MTASSYKILILLAIFIASFLTLSPAKIQAQLTEFDVNMHSSPVIDANPGETITLQFEINNPTTESVNLKDSLQFPESWTLLDNLDDFTVAPGTTVKKDIKLRIPYSPEEGSFSIKYTLLDNDTLKPIVDYEVEVLVEDAQAPVADNITINPITPEAITAESGQTVNLRFMIVNQGDDQIKLSNRLNLPAGWVASVFDQSFYSLPSQKSKLQFLVIAIPKSAAAGEYEINFLVQQHDNQKNLATITTKVNIPSTIKLEGELHDVPKSLLAGKSYSPHLTLNNAGNTPLKLKVQATTSPRAQISNLPSSVNIAPRERLKLPFTVTTNDALIKTTGHNLDIILSNTENGEEIFKTYTSLTLYPSKAVQVEKYKRLPSTFQAKFDDRTWNSEGGDIDLAFYGSGNINGDNRLDYSLRGPLRSTDDRPFFTKDTRAFAQYTANDYHIKGGDSSFSTSQLVETRSGRGIEGKLYSESFTGRLHYVENNPSSTQTQNSDPGYGGTLTYKPNNLYQISLNSVRTRDLPSTPRNMDISSAQIYSLYSNLTPVYSHYLPSTEAEWGISKSDPETHIRSAYKVTLKGLLPLNFDYNISKQRSQHLFLGEFHDEDLWSVNCRLPITQKLSTEMVWHQRLQNLNLSNEISSSAPKKEIFYFSLSYSTSIGANIAAIIKRQRSKDRMPTLSNYTDQNTYSLRSNWAISKYRLTSEIERGQYHDILLSKQKNIQKYRLSVAHRPFTNLSYGISANIGHRSYSTTPRWGFEYKGTATWKISQDSLLRCNYDRLEQGTHNRRDSWTTNYKHQFQNGNAILANTGYSVTRSDGSDPDHEFIFSITYTVPFGIPVGLNRQASSVKGKVVRRDNQQETPLPNILVRLNQQTTLTDEQGEYIFPLVSPGEKRIFVDKKNYDLVPTQDMPINFDLGESETRVIDIVYMPGGTIKGQVLQLPNKKTANQDETQDKKSINIDFEPGVDEPTPYPGTIVFIQNTKNKDDYYQDVVDEQGNFSFQNIPFGQWKVIAKDNALPPKHKFVEDSSLVNIEAGETVEVFFEVVKEKRKIEMLSPV
ncbi:MAG: NEW3 domain-containing protein [Chlamydiota bacterium]